MRIFFFVVVVIFLGVTYGQGLPPTDPCWPLWIRCGPPPTCANATKAPESCCLRCPEIPTTPRPLESALRNTELPYIADIFV
ncbi:hypothetical protein DPMN_167238 [Dreissena polymorpha]|uniref:Uncharacterized protein n=1 Tax=Dreissena polymorpha TaxID=45954 RepID=A0A9D4EYE9_DREPO|nr:hypothetical protein DPMN_167238 [Dreissena polymorpha]